MNALCGICKQYPSKFCICKNVVIVLCENCSSKHEIQHSSEVHDYNPLVYLDVCLRIGIDQFIQRKNQVVTGSAFVRKLQELEEAQYEDAKQKIAEATKQYTDWLDYLHTSFKALTTNFEREKFIPLTTEQFYLSLFTYSVFEMGMSTFPSESPLIEQGPLERLQNALCEMQARLDQFYRQTQNFENYFVDFIKTGTRVESGRNSLPRMAPAGQSGYFGAGNERQQGGRPRDAPQSAPEMFRAYVPFSRGRLLAKWMCDTTELEKVVVNRSIDFTNVTVSVVLPDGNLLSCGGRDQHESRAIVINTKDGNVTSLPDMNKGRGNPGLVYTNEVAYVFGGFVSETDEELSCGEKFSFQQKAWTMLPTRMANSRFQFTPFCHERTVYLAGGWHTTSVEAFDIPSERFSQLPLVLPKPFGTTCFVYNNELVVIQDKKLIRWALNSRSGDAQRQGIDVGAKDSNVGVQIVGRKAYYTHETKKCCDVHEVDLQTWDVTEVASLSNSDSGSQPCPVA